MQGGVQVYAHSVHTTHARSVDIRISNPCCSESIHRDRYSHFSVPLTLAHECIRLVRSPSNRPRARLLTQIWGRVVCSCVARVAGTGHRCVNTPPLRHSRHSHLHRLHRHHRPCHHCHRPHRRRLRDHLRHRHRHFTVATFAQKVRTAHFMFARARSTLVGDSDHWQRGRGGSGGYPPC